MNARIEEWGSSQGIRLSKHVLEEANLSTGDEVDIAVEGGVIVVKPAGERLARGRLAEMVKQIPENYRSGEVDWGGPAGKEVW